MDLPARTRPLEVAIDVTPAMGALGGIPRAIIELSRGLWALSGEVRLWPWAAACRDRELRARDLGLGMIGGPSWPQAALRALWKMGWDAGVPRVDVFHATTPICPPTAGWGGCRAVVATIHDMAAFGDPAWFEPRARREFQAWTRLAVARAHRLIVPSQATARALCQVFPEAEERLAVIPHGCDHALRAGRGLTTGCGILRARDGEGRPVVLEPGPGFLHVGTVQPRKGLEILIAAAPRLPERLVILGRPGWLSAPIYAAAKQSPARQRIFFANQVSDVDLDIWYRRASALLFPSPCEGFGFPIFEAASRGLPVAVSPGSPAQEFLGDDCWEVTGGAAAWTAAALALFESNRAKRKAKAAQERARNLTWTRCAQAVAHVYRDAFELALRARSRSDRFSLEFP